MTKQKEKVPDGDNARVRFALYTDEATLEQVKQNYKQDGCGCMSEYVTKAIRYYISASEQIRTVNAGRPKSGLGKISPCLCPP